eukprot:TRINITY_DN94324_c0_g1_i1.p1 TRINITY_DN94324_c0_g1~~TRINITY_DN94324_c0_g1_i1.p1  ORF type:complete len:357 (-),score=18.83 TRINITY_DN94324_c0_g1_i1:234-1304(-)
MSKQTADKPHKKYAPYKKYGRNQPHNATMQTQAGQYRGFLPREQLTLEQYNQQLAQTNTVDFQAQRAKQREKKERSYHNVNTTYLGITENNCTVKIRTFNIHLVSFASKAYQAALDRLISEANQTGWFTSITGYSLDDLPADFMEKYSDILQQPRGGGYWMWRFWIIPNKLAQVPEDDVVVFLDSGCSLNPSPVAACRFLDYLHMMKNSETPIITMQNKRNIEQQYATRELFAYFNVSDDGPLARQTQIQGGTLLMRNSPWVRNLYKQAIAVVDFDHGLITDRYNKLEADKPPWKRFFVEGRHDQAIMSLLVKTRGSIMLRSEVGNSYSDEMQYPIWANRWTLRTHHPLLQKFYRL